MGGVERSQVEVGNAMKHGCGTRGAAPASDAAGRSDAIGTPLPARPAASCHVDSTCF